MKKLISFLAAVSFLGFIGCEGMDGMMGADMMGADMMGKGIMGAKGGKMGCPMKGMGKSGEAKGDLDISQFMGIFQDLQKAADPAEADETAPAGG